MPLGWNHRSNGQFFVQRGFSNGAQKTELYRMVTPKHICPWGLKALDLLKREGFDVEDHHLKSREETDAFKTKHQVKTTPQTFIDGTRVGGYDDLRKYLGKEVKEKGAVSLTESLMMVGMAVWMILKPMGMGH